MVEYRNNRVVLRNEKPVHDAAGYFTAVHGTEQEPRLFRRALVNHGIAGHNSLVTYEVYKKGDTVVDGVHRPGDLVEFPLDDGFADPGHPPSSPVSQLTSGGYNKNLAKGYRHASAADLSDQRKRGKANAAARAELVASKSQAGQMTIMGEAMARAMISANAVAQKASQR